MTKTLAVGETFKITATTLPSGVPAEILWTTAENTIIELSSTGKTATVIATAEGPATVTAQIQDKPELKAESKITVTPVSP